jgi:hypothetical protein
VLIGGTFLSIFPMISTNGSTHTPRFGQILDRHHWIPAMGDFVWIVTRNWFYKVE